MQRESEEDKAAHGRAHRGLGVRRHGRTAT